MLDLEFIGHDEFDRRHYEYSYMYRGQDYGFARAQLNEQLVTNDNVFIIVRHFGMIQRLMKEYHFINVVPVFIHSDHDELEKRLIAEGLPREVIDERLEHSEGALQDYFRHPHVYREIMLNTSSKEVFHDTIQKQLIDKYSDAPAIDPFLVAVMMSFNKSNKKLPDYYDAMEGAVKSISPNYRCTRIDNTPGSVRIASEFRSLIHRARCSIVDLTENKQNVYYELGYAHARGATCIITAEEGTEPSFYPREHKIVFYDSAHDLKKKLVGELMGILRGPAGM